MYRESQPDSFMDKLKSFKMLSLLCILTIFLGSTSTQHAQFYGGSMSFEIEKFGNDYKAIIKILTAWKIGYGPCGSTCPYSKIGTSTSMSRSNALNSHNFTYLGEWSGERQKMTSGSTLVTGAKPIYMDFTSKVNSRIVEKVQLVNIKLGWEMEQAEVSVTVPSGTDYIDFKFNGTYWTRSNVIQVKGSTAPTLHPWYMQTKIRTAVRSDIGRSNRSPVLQIKPYYRLVLGEPHKIEITYIDQDNDIVRCEAASTGTSRGIDPPKDLTVNAKDCIINFDVKASKYNVHDTGIVLIDVMDFNKKDMILGTGPNAIRFAGNNLKSRSLSSVPLQFYFEVVDHLNSPEFIHPTPPHRQLFEIYVGARFNIEVFAKPTDPNSSVTIERFFFLRRDGIQVVRGPMLDRTEVDSRAKSMMVTWIPKPTETGNHALCSNVIDTIGEDAFSLRCFTITVRDIPNKPDKPLVGQPYFLQFPSDTDITCQVNSVCRFPIYAKTDNPGGITEIRIVHPEIFSLRAAGQITAAPAVIDSDAKMIEVSFQDPDHGKKKFCVKAFDKYKSFEQCTYVKIKPKDPCLSSPCHNSGECLSKEDGTYQCVCSITGTYGELCEKKRDPCEQMDCKNGATCTNGWCLCPPGVTGIYCENVLSVCLQSSCNGHGICVDKPRENPDHICQCTNSYTGQDCTTNHQPVDCNVTPNDPSCTSCPGSSIFNPCNSGKCVKNGTSYSCICPVGFTGQDCDTELDTTRYSLNSKFVPPTLPFGSVIQCDPLWGGIDNDLTCEFPIYVFWNGNGVKPIVEVTSKPKDIVLDRSSGPQLTHLLPSKVHGLDQTFMATVLFASFGRKPFKTGLHIVCLNVKQGQTETDHRCFNVDVVHHTLKIHKKEISGDGRYFVSPTLPEGSDIVCRKNTPCHISVYTTYKYTGTKCLSVVLPSSAQCTVFEPTRIELIRNKVSCFSDIVYNITSLAAGSKQDFCLEASEHGESRCFMIHITADTKDPCLTNPCENDGFCSANIDGTHSCVCQKGFTGANCEIGTCPPAVTQSKNCQNEGHCHTNGVKYTCYCRLGTEGTHCSHKTIEGLTNPAQEGAKFKGSSLPTTIKCYLGEPCQIPSILTGDPHKMPLMGKGFVSSGVEVQGINVTQDKDFTHLYHSVTTVLPKKTGMQKVCIQSLVSQSKTSDEVCYDVEVTSDPPKPASVKKPMFIPPTLPDGSYIQCSYGKACHLTLWLKNHPYQPLCPRVISDLKAQDGVYVFQSDTLHSPCSVDVSIHTDIERTFRNCFSLTTPQEGVVKKYGGDGEERCYNITITKDPLHAHGPCSTLRCDNEGFCNGKGKTGFCQCPSGYSGPTCGVSNGNTLTAPHSQTKPKFGDHVIPEKVVCVLHEECSVPLSITSTTQPVLKPGHIDPGLTTKESTMTQDPNNPGTFVSSFKLVGTTPGVHKACVQTGQSIGSTNDEVCFEVEVKTPESNHHKIETSRPHFIEPTVPHDSVTQCVPGKSCHILLFMTGGAYPDCPSIKQTQGPTEDLHLFTSADNKVIGSCTVDVTLTPPAESRGKYRFCFNTFLPNVPGETRCIYVEYLPYTGSNPSCKGQSCSDGSLCDIVGVQPKCICALSQAGSQCEKDGSAGPDHTLPQPKLTDYPLPKVVKCEIGKTCHIPMLVSTGPNKNTKPVVTSRTVGSPDITQTQPNVTKESKYPDGTYIVTVPVKPTSEGQHEVCVKIQQIASEHCFKVEAITNPTPTPPSNTKGHFEEPSLPPDSTVVCQPGSTCHLVVYQKPDSGKCTPVIGQSVPGGAHIVTPSTPNDAGLCETDIIYKPTAGTKSHKICVQAKGDNNGNAGETRCYTVDPSVTDIDPCLSVNCHTGECVITEDVPVCKCPLGTSGKLCDEDSRNLITGHNTEPAFVDTVKPKKVVCYHGLCRIPLAVTNSGGVSPILRIENNGETLNTTHVPGTNISQAIVKIRLHSNSNNTVCVSALDPQSSSVNDTVCFKAEFSQGMPPLQKGSKFTDSMLGLHSTVSCQTGLACHLIVETTTTAGGKCPKIINTDPDTQDRKLHDVYVFKPKQNVTVCQTDVSITPSNGEIGEKEVCVQIDKSSPAAGDKRCYKVTVEKGNPCLPVQCKNGGFCDNVDEYEGVAVCICPTGFSGNRCQIGHGNPLTPVKVEELPNEEKQKGTPKFIETSLPETIMCVICQQCHLPLRITDQTGRKPILGFGEVDPGLITSPPKVTPDGNMTFTTDVVVTPTKLGRRRVCVQTKNFGHINIDEVCYNIETKATGKTVTGSPKFTEPTIAENSVVICQPGQTCHIPLTYNKSGTCEKVSETPPTPGVHIFQDNPQTGQKCKVDVGFTPNPDGQGTSQMCFKPGSNGEKRCITVKVQDTSSESSTPCQSHHCHRNSFCSVPTGSQAVCTCAVGSTGPYCKTDSTKSSVTGSSGPGSKFVDTVVPREVKCYKNQPCTIPFSIKGTANIKIGDKDPDLNPTINPSQKIDSTNGVYHHSVTVTPHTDGKKSMCVNTGDNKEQICFEIDVVDPPKSTGTFPKYTGPTLGPDSMVDCQTETLCHITVQTEKQTDGKCPPIMEKTDETFIFDVHIFPPNPATCTTDVAFKPIITETGQKQICLHMNSGSPSDTKRCFKVMVSNTKDPCVPVYCMNNGECQVKGTIGECICPAGFTGNKCQTEQSEKVTPVDLTHVTPEKPHFTDTAVPKIIKCIKDTPCHVPLTVTEPTGHVPSVKFGNVDPGLETEKPVLTNVNGTKDFTTDIVVTPKETGRKSLCVQTVSSQGTNVDEICYVVQTSATRLTPTGSPQYTKPTVTDSSTLICEVGQVCHIPLTYQGLKGKCEELAELPSHQDGVHIFKPPLQPTATDQTCTTDVAYKSPTAGTTTLCFKPGTHGEKRCLNIETKNRTDLFTPCQVLHCKRSGHCISQNTTAECMCAVGTSGLDCGQNSISSITDRSKTAKPAFTDTVLPQKIVCYKSEKCTIPFVVTEKPGGTGPTVVRGQIDAGLNPQGPSHPTAISNTNSYNTELTLTPSTTGDKHACIQTKDSGSKVDEICVEIAVKDRPTGVTVTSPKFTEKSLLPESKIACTVHYYCHLLMETTLKPDGECPTISKDDSTTTVSEVHPLDTKKIQGHCKTDVVVHPTTLETGLKKVCFQINVSPSEGPRCYELNVTESKNNPCNNVTCDNGGVCEDIDQHKAVCICPSGYSGKTCQNGISRTAQGNPLTPFNEGNLTSKEKQKGTPKFIETSLPETITCVKDQPCHLPLKITDQTGKKPTVGFGHVDTGISTSTPEITPTGNKMFTTDVVVTPTEIGKKKVCVQTQNSGNINVDEICYNIDTLDKSTTTAGTPKFTEPTVGENSVVVCQPGNTCHIPLTYEKTGRCENVTEIQHTTGVHIFQDNSQTGQKCEVDVGFTPNPDGQGTSQMCFKPGTNGQQRCIIVKVQNTSSASTPCQSHHCHRGGFCSVQTGSQAVCICKVGSTGLYCKTDSTKSVVTGTSGPETKFVDTVVPREVKCYKDQPCLIPFTVKGTGAFKIGDKDPGVNPVIIPGQKIVPTDGVHRHSLSVTSHTDGKKSVCVNTGTGTEQLCFKIDVVDPPTGPKATPAYTGTTLESNSTIECQTDAVCHLPIQTETDQNGKCPTILEKTAKTSISNVHVFPPDTSLSCLTDVALKPTVSEVGDKQICLQINSGSSSERCYKVHVSSKPDPCISVFCLNNGSCQVTGTTAGCNCPAEFTGNKCQSEITKTTPTISSKMDSTTPDTTASISKILASLATPTNNQGLVSISSTIVSLTPSTTYKGQVVPSSRAGMSTASETSTPGTTYKGQEVPSSGAQNGAGMSTASETSTLGTTYKGQEVPSSGAGMSTASETSTPGTTYKGQEVPSSGAGMSTASETSTPGTTYKGQEVPSSGAGMSTASETPTSGTTYKGQEVPSSGAGMSTASETSTPGTTYKGQEVPSSGAQNGAGMLTASLTSTPGTTYKGQEVPSSGAPNGAGMLTASETSTPGTTYKGQEVPSSGAPNGAGMSTASETSTTGTTHKDSIVSLFSNRTRMSTAYKKSTTGSPSAVTSRTPGTSTMASERSSVLGRTIISNTAIPSTLPSITTGIKLSAKGSGVAPKSTVTSKIPGATGKKLPGAGNSVKSTSVNMAAKSTTSATSVNGGVSPTTSMKPLGTGQNSGQCSSVSLEQAREAAKMGRVTCTCIVNGKKKEIIRQNPKATTEQLVKAAGIGAGSVSGAMVIAWLIYMLVSKVKDNSHSNLPPTPRPGRILPSRRKSVDLPFT